MLNNKNIFFALALIILILFLSVYGFFFIRSTVSMKALPEGPVRLSEGTTLSIDDGWEAYTDRELSAETDLEPGIFGTGEYYFRLILDTDGLQGQNAFLLNPVHTAYELYVNGDLLANTGVPSTVDEQPALNRTIVVPYQQTSDRLELVFHVSNFSRRYGGTQLNWISYGRYQDVEQRRIHGIVLDFLIVFVLAVISFLHLFNHFYRRNNNRSLFFFLFIFVYTFYSLFSGRVIAGWMIPVLPPVLVFRLEEFFIICAMPLLMNYIKSLYPDEIHSPVVLTAQILSAVFGVLVLALPVQAAIYASFAYTVIRILGAVYLLFVLTAAARNSRAAAVFTLITVSIMFLCILNDFLNAAGLIVSARLVYAGVFIFAAQQTFRLVTDNISDYRNANETRIRLEAITAQSDRFFSRNSQELDRPVRNIIELGESLLKGSIGPLNSEQIATSSLIVSNGVRLSNMMSDILDFTKMKDQSIELNLGPVELFKVVRKVINSCESMVAVRDLELGSEIERDSAVLYADEKRVEQILYNLLSNGIRHTGSGRIIIGGTEREGRFEIEIRIEGSDLDAELVKGLLEAWRENPADDIEGTDISDISLSIARKLIELHDCKVNVEENDKVLTYRFCFELWTGEKPASEEEALEMDALINLQPVLDEITSDRDIEILIAGKDVEELQILKSQLSSMNYSVVPFISGRELLSRIGDSIPDLIVIDVKLPDISGYEVCSEIRKKFSKDELPVILVINKEDISDMMEGLTSGANDFLTRPYLQEEFLTRVNTHLQLSRISNVYSRFVPTEFLSSLGQENIIDVELGDQVSREMTILFVDIRAFTNLSENMTPEENFKFINSYLSRFSPMITNNGGFVDKYIGDAIMALFPDKPENALAAAKEMIEHVNVYNGHRANCGYKPINIGIGIHTGNMILGIIGDEKRMQGTVISDAVNLASRIQDVTKLYKANVVISQETFVKLENPMDYNFRFLGRVKVKGKDRAVALFEIFDADAGEKLERKNSTKADFEEAIMKFSRRDFGEAQNLLEKVAAADPEDMTAGVFLERIEEMRRAEKKAFLTSL